MKKLSLLLFLFVFAFTACEKDEDMYKVLPVDQVKVPVLAAHDAIVFTEDNQAELTTFQWQGADFGVPTAPEYTLYFQVADGEPVAITSTFGKSLDVKLEDLNKALINTGMEPNAAKDVQFFLMASISDTYESVKSAPITVNVTPFKPTFPDVVYMIGQEFGGWNWGDAAVVEMTPINGTPGKFWAVRYFADPANGFKWNSAKDWDGNEFSSLGTDVGYTVSGDAFVSEAGFYIFVVDYTTGTITFEPAQVYGMGDCFGGWNTGQYPFAAAGNVMKLTTANAGELRIYANANAAGVGGDWWRMEFVILDGKIAYRGNGGDQTRVPVEAGKVVTLNFNTGTGTIE